MKMFLEDFLGIVELILQFTTYRPLSQIFLNTTAC